MTAKNRGKTATAARPNAGTPVVVSTPTAPAVDMPVNPQSAYAALLDNSNRFTDYRANNLNRELILKAADIAVTAERDASESATIVVGKVIVLALQASKTGTAPTREELGARWGYSKARVSQCEKVGRVILAGLLPGDVKASALVRAVSNPPKGNTATVGDSEVSIARALSTALAARQSDYGTPVEFEQTVQGIVRAACEAATRPAAKVITPATPAVAGKVEQSEQSEQSEPRANSEQDPEVSARDTLVQATSRIRFLARNPRLAGGISDELWNAYQEAVAELDAARDAEHNNGE